MSFISRAEAVERYGEIDFASRHWPEQSEWITMLKIPQGVFPHWKVLDTDLPVRRIACNKDMAQKLEYALENVVYIGLADLLLTFDGCFNIRMVRGSTKHFSAHSYGLAIDLNARQNPLGARSGGFYRYPDFVNCFKAQGFTWGGDFHNRKDPMHFSYSWE